MASSFKSARDAFKRLPGVGHRSAERFIFHLLAKRQDNEQLIEALSRLHKETKPCKICGLISDHNPCKICTSPTRRQDIICVVKSVHDAFRIERTGGFTGLYHVLGALLSPFHEIQEQDLTLDALYTRVRGTKTELFIAFEDSLEGEATFNLIQDRLQSEPQIHFTRMAIGIPLGAGIEHIDSETLKRSLKQRNPLTPRSNLAEQSESNYQKDDDNNLA